MIKYKFINANLFAQAMIHSSIDGDSLKNYERLEFLGDRVLGLSVAKMLYESFDAEPEGSLSQRLTGLVCKETVAKVALKIGLDKKMKIANPELINNENVLCDVFEALTGAIFLDGGYEAASRFIKDNFYDLLFSNLTPPKDAKTRLQEEAHIKGFGVPIYEVFKKSGSEHEPVFEIAVKLKGLEPVLGTGKNKKHAEFEAAGKMLEVLKNR